MRLYTGRKVIVRLLGAGVCSVAAVSAAHGDEWFVDANAPTTGQTGEDWDHPWVTIQQAVENPELAAGDFILVAGGTYKPSSQSTSINLASGVSIQGGYRGYTTVPGENPNSRNEVSILSGDLDNNDNANPPVYTDNALNVVQILNDFDPPDVPDTAPPEDKANLDRFTITAGRGGGIFAYPFDVTAVIRDCEIYGNLGNYGGGYASLGADLTFRKCDFHDNVANVEGGGLYFEGTVRLLDCLVRENTAQFDGAGIKCDGGTTVLKVVSSTIKDNQSRSTFGSGAGISMKAKRRHCGAD